MNMRTLAEDTSPEMEAVLIGLLRKRTPAQKLRSMMGLRELATRLMLNNLRSHSPQATADELQYGLNVRRWGQEISDRIFWARQKALRLEANTPANELQIIVSVTKRLEALKIPHFIQGGIASIIYGEERLTNDADIVIRSLPFHIQRFVQAFENDFVVSVEAVQDALNKHYAFNIIHIETAFKIDFYPVTDADEMEISAFARRQAHDIGAGEIWLASAEDVVLAKLHWFRKGGEVSEKQWRDILGILKVQGSKIDFTYLEPMAARFGLADLLQRAREDAGEI
ncbi:MAG: hypothetical protein ILNGONEN_01714 [Syntrophorhabdaceae bacterium]|nr:hypothetical protein [Syntrophorhabdaceae bacterium]